jgi:hypothetical protein
MISLNMEEKAMIFNYVLSTSQVILVLEDAAAGKELVDQQCKILRRGVNLLSRIIEGAAIVERKGLKNGLAPTMEGLSVYGYALSTLGKLDEIKEGEGFTEFFEKMHDEMLRLLEKRKKDDINILLLERFFLALGNSLRGDIQKETYPKEKNLPYIKKTQMNEYPIA